MRSTVFVTANPVYTMYNPMNILSNLLHRALGERRFSTLVVIFDSPLSKGKQFQKLRINAALFLKTMTGMASFLRKAWRELLARLGPLELFTQPLFANAVSTLTRLAKDESRQGKLLFARDVLLHVCQVGSDRMSRLNKKRGSPQTLIPRFLLGQRWEEIATRRCWISAQRFKQERDRHRERQERLLANKAKKGY